MGVTFGLILLFIVPANAFLPLFSRSIKREFNVYLLNDPLVESRWMIDLDIGREEVLKFSWD